MKIIILNGPKGVGKDTLADELAARLNPRAGRFQMKDALYSEALRWLYSKGVYITPQNFHAMCTYRELKEQPTSLFPRGMSPREVLIKVSEEVIKPKYGDSFFGDKAADTVRKAKELKPEMKYAIFSDGGFQCEVDALRPLGEVIVIQLSAGWTQFDCTDSRGYIMGDVTHLLGRTWNNIHRDVDTLEELIKD